jgi:inner membrane protein
VVAAAIALTLSSAYLLYGLSQNLRAESEARRQLAQDGVLAADIRATPTMFQPWLRRVVVQEESGLRVGFVSTWAPSGIAWTCLPRLRDQAVAAALAAPQAQLFAWFADGQLWPALRRDDQGRTVVRLTDLRYGFPGPTLVGWWGLDVTLDAEGRAVGAQRFRIARGASTAAIAALYAAAFGDVARLSAVGGGEVPAAMACR